MTQARAGGRHCGWALALGLTALASISGCSLIRQTASRFPAADIDAIYAEALTNPERNPVILIHGFTGAKIVRTADGATVWGAFFTDGAPLPSTPEGLRSIALDIDGLPDPVRPQDLLHIDDDSHASEFLERARAGVLVTDFEYGVYAAMVAMVERAGYAPCRGVGEPAPVSDMPACFTFFYDWRQDNVGNAIALGRFIDEASRQLEAAGGDDDNEPIRFDILAHSMGGLITRYFLRFGARDVLSEAESSITWAGAEHISRAILIATPNFGAMEALQELITGVKYPVVRYEQTLLATCVSLYQMLPRERHELWLDPGGQPTPFEFMSAEIWQRNGWGPFSPKQARHLEVLFPGVMSADERSDRMAAFMGAAFERARRFMEAIDRHPETPPPVPLILFAADATPTLARAEVSTSKNGQTVLRFGDGKRLNSPGDGRVTRASALADERIGGGPSGWLRSPIPWAQTIFLTDAHMSMLGNPTFQNNLLHLLLERKPEEGR